MGKVPPKGQTHPLQHGASIFLKTWSRVVSATLGFCQGFDKFVPILEAGLGLPTYSQIKRISGALIWYRTPLRGVDGPPCIAADPVVGCRFWVSGVPLSASVVGYSYYPNRFFLCVCVLFWRLLVYFHIYPSSGAGLKAKDTLQIRKPSLGKKKTLKLGDTQNGYPASKTKHTKIIQRDQSCQLPELPRGEVGLWADPGVPPKKTTLLLFLCCFLVMTRKTDPYFPPESLKLEAR